MRGLVAVPLIAATTLVLGGPALLSGLLDRSGRTAHAIARAWARVVLWVCGLRVRVSDRSGFPTPAVYAANHGSALDIPLLFAGLPIRFRIIHKRSLFALPVVGWFLRLGGHIAIDRGNPFKARRSLEQAALRVRQGASVLVFPEGTRSRDGQVAHFKRGSFVLAINAGVPVVPVSLVGVKALVPRGPFSLRSGEISIVLHPPLLSAGRSEADAPALAEEARGIVASAI